MGALLKGFRILGKVLSVDVNSPGALGFISKHWQGIFIQLLTALDRATGRRRRRRRQRHFWLHRHEWWSWGSRPETKAGKSLFRIQLNASGSIHNTLRRLVIATECSIPTRPQTSELSVHFEKGSRNGAVYHREPLQLTHAGPSYYSHMSRRHSSAIYGLQCKQVHSFHPVSLQACSKYGFLTS